MPAGGVLNWSTACLQAEGRHVKHCMPAGGGIFWSTACLQAGSSTGALHACRGRGQLAGHCMPAGGVISKSIGYNLMRAQNLKTVVICGKFQKLDEGWHVRQTTVHVGRVQEVHVGQLLLHVISLSHIILLEHIQGGRAWGPVLGAAARSESSWRAVLSRRRLPHERGRRAAAIPQVSNCQII